MKIERINENKIKVTLTTHDLKNFDIDINSAAITPEKVEEIFHNMLRIAEQETGFVTYDSQLMIEARPMTDGGGELVMYITRIDGGSLPQDTKKIPKNAKLIARKKKEAPPQPFGAVYRFERFDDLIAGLLDAPENAPVSSQLFFYNKVYYLVFIGEKEAVKQWEFLFCEHGQKVRSLNARAFLVEHGELFMEQNAIETLIQHF